MTPPPEPRTYAVEDRSMLGDPPWQPTDPELQAWEKAHGHDVRLDCDVYTPCHIAITDLEDRAEAADVPLREALERIDRDGCHNFYGGQRCWEAGRLRDALYGAEKWCDACVARAALTARAAATEPLAAPLDTCVCQHPKVEHYFGDRLGDDGRMHSWCQMQPGHCTDYRRAAAMADTDAQ